VRVQAPDTDILVNVGPHSFSIKFNAPNTSVPPGLSLLGITDYQVNVSKGAYLNGPVLDGYPRYIAKGINPQSWQGGGLTPATKYTFGVRALHQGGHGGPWVGATFTTPAG
jgi:hypothetical protein